MRILELNVIRKQIAIMTGLMMLSFVVEFVDIAFDILYFNEVTGSQFQSYFHTGQRLNNFMVAFLFMGIAKSIITLLLGPKTMKEGFEDGSFYTRLNHIVFTFVFEE